LQRYVAVAVAIAFAAASAAAVAGSKLTRIPCPQLNKLFASCDRLQIHISLLKVLEGMREPGGCVEAQCLCASVHGLLSIFR